MNTAKPRKHRAPGRAWALSGFLLGAIVSIGFNLQAAWLPADQPDTASDWAPSVPSQIGAVVWPVALMVSVEVLSRIAWPNGWGWKAMRVLGILAVAGGSGVISYGHIYAVLKAWGYGTLGAAVGPLVIDGLMLISGFALVSLGRAARVVLDASQEAAAEAPPAVPSRTNLPHLPTSPAGGEESASSVAPIPPTPATEEAPREASSPVPEEASPEVRTNLRLVQTRRVKRASSTSRKAARANAPSDEDVFAEIASYAQQNAGTLPSPNWLKTNLSMSWGRAKDLLEEYVNKKQEVTA